MIKVDYLIRRDEGNETVEYKPELIPTEIPNVAYIQGPNSSGKSTLLNIIALAFYGLKLSNDELDDNLRLRIKNLIDSGHQKISFDIDIDNEQLGLHLNSKKKDFDSKDIVVRLSENGESTLISADTFHKNYKLIYDIPNNPLERLPNLLVTIRNDQRYISNKLADFMKLLRDIIVEIQEAKDPKRITQLKGTVEKYKDNLDTKIEQLVNKRNNQKRLKEYYYSKFLSVYKNDLENLNNRISELEKQEKKKKAEESKSYKIQKTRMRELEKCISEAEKIKEEIVSLLPNLIDLNDKHRYKMWFETSIQNEIFYPDIYDSLRIESEYFYEYLYDRQTEEYDTFANDLEMEKMIKSLIVILRDYSKSELKIPGIDLTVNDFIHTLKEDLTKYQESTLIVQNIDHCYGLLNNFIVAIDNGIKHRKTVDSIRKDLSDEEFESLAAENELVEQKAKKKKIIAIISTLENKAIKDDIDPKEISEKYNSLKKAPDLEDYEIYTEEQLINKLINIQENINDFETECVRLETLIDDKNEEIKRLEQQEPHKHQDHFDEIQKLLSKTQNLAKQFSIFDGYINNIISKKFKYDSMKDNELNYANRVGIYLAKKVGSIRHIDKVHNIRSLDVILDKIITEEDKEIRFVDLGTGQGQAAYLDTLLSMSGDRKIIALLDEVAMMDEHSLAPIKNRLKTLYETDKLVMAIIVQKGDMVKVESII